MPSDIATVPDASAPAVATSSPTIPSLKRADGETLWAVCVFILRHEGRYGTGLTPDQAEDALKLAGGNVKAARKAGSMKRLPAGVTHFAVDCEGTIRWELPGKYSQCDALAYDKKLERWVMAD
jgi:hypothetical protein